MYTKSNQRPTEVIGRNTSFYSIYTLIDVTDSNVSSPKINAKKFYQSQNLNTFMQVIGLRTQPIISSVTKLESQNMAEYNFGNDYTGTHTIWLMKFVSETEGAWNKDDIETAFTYGQNWPLGSALSIILILIIGCLAIFGVGKVDLDSIMGRKR